MSQKFDIFISYRRDGGFETANILYDRLTTSGYRVFMDVENLRSGKFNTQLYKQIENCNDVIVVLGPNGLERCKNEDDWLRLEIAHAFQKEKNVVPVFLRGFKFPEEPLPADIAELPNFQGVEASQEFFNAFLKRLKLLLTSRRFLTWKRIRKQVIYILVPIIIAGGIMSYFHLQNQRQYEQICKEVVSSIGVGFGNDNNLVTIMENVHKEWGKFHTNYKNASSNDDKQRIRKEYLNFIDYSISQIKDTMNLLPVHLSQTYEDVLTKNGISTEDVKATRMIFTTNIANTKDYLNKMKYWANCPETGWPEDIDEGMDYIFEMDKEIIVSNIYSFVELIKTMPVSVRDNYLKIRPSLSQFPDVGFDRSKEELEALQEQSLEKIRKLLQDYSSVVGNEKSKLQQQKNNLDLLKKKRVDESNAVITKKTDSLKNNIATNRKVINESKEELNIKKSSIRLLYDKMLARCAFDKSEDQWMQWGKIVHLSQYGKQSIINEKNNKEEYLKLRESFKKAGQDPNTVEPLDLVVPVKEVYDEIQRKLDKYMEYNKEKDITVGQYVFAAKQYYKLVSQKKIEPIGTLITGTENNVPHPVLKPGDIIIERKGKKIFTNDDYFKLKDDPNPNVVKIIRFNSNGTKTELTEKLPESKVIVGMVNL